ncbi:hypothetical protein B0H17DRAFT_1076810, partial [Mycena rosella]
MLPLYAIKYSGAILPMAVVHFSGFMKCVAAPVIHSLVPSGQFWWCRIPRVCGPLWCSGARSLSGVCADPSPFDASHIPIVTP